jgi:hypothetical protein
MRFRLTALGLHLLASCIALTLILGTLYFAWYRWPGWQDSEQRDKIVGAAISGGDDVISMPRYYQPWDSGLATLRTQLKKVDDVKYFYGKEKQILKERMQAAGIATDQLNSIPLTGRGHYLLVVFDPASLRIAAILKAK